MPGSPSVVPRQPVRFGEACVRAVGVAALASVPAGLRTAAAGGAFGDGLLLGIGILVPILTLAMVLIRAAGRGFRYVVGAEPARVVVLGLALWIGLATPALVGLGAALKALTNHRGLGGTTFAALGLVAVTLAALVAHRLVLFGRSLLERGTRPGVVAGIGAAFAVIPTILAAGPLGARTVDATSLGVRAAIMDGAVVVVACALAASIELRPPWTDWAGRFGVVLATALFVAAGVRIETSRATTRAFEGGGGLTSTLLGVLERWSDRDGDGEGSHFGGHDCDDGDARRHSGASEIPGDGVDQDCDGIDPPALAAQRPSGSAEPRARAGGTVAAGVKQAEPEAAPNRPDILVVTLDTVRADHTLPYGYDKPTTPRLLALAERGVVFEHAYAPGSDTQRALAPLVSGKPLHETPRDKRDWPTLLPEIDTLAERLARSGYFTAAVTSFTWLSEERGFAQGFKIFEPVYKLAHPEREVTGPHAVRAAVEALGRLQKDARPFFLWVHLFDAHERYLEHPGVKFGKGKKGAYDGEIAFVDSLLGELLGAVEKSPRASKTAVIVHGSHGEAFGEHDVTGHGNDLYEPLLRVPLVIAAPGVAKARYQTGAVSTLDVPATVAELAGAPREGFAGVSLLPVLRGERKAARGPVYARTQKKSAIVDWPLKLLVTERKKGDRTALFDLSADAAEANDLSSARPDDLARLLKAKGAIERTPK